MLWSFKTKSEWKFEVLEFYGGVDLVGIEHIFCFCGWEVRVRADWVQIHLKRCLGVCPRLILNHLTTLLISFSHRLPAGSSTLNTWWNWAFGVAVFWKALPHVSWCFLFIFLNQTSIQLLLWSFQQCVYYLRYKLHYQTKVDPTLISDPFKAAQTLVPALRGHMIPASTTKGLRSLKGFKRIWNRRVTPVIWVRLCSGICQRRMVLNFASERSVSETSAGWHDRMVWLWTNVAPSHSDITDWQLCRCAAAGFIFQIQTNLLNQTWPFTSYRWASLVTTASF